MKSALTQRQIDFKFESSFNDIDQLLLTPDGATLYLRSGSELIIARKRQEAFRVREVVDLTLGIKSTR